MTVVVASPRRVINRYLALITVLLDFLGSCEAVALDLGRLIPPQSIGVHRAGAILSLPHSSHGCFRFLADCLTLIEFASNRTRLASVIVNFFEFFLISGLASAVSIAIEAIGTVSIAPEPLFQHLCF